MREDENDRDYNVFKVHAAYKEISHYVGNTDHYGEFLFTCCLLGGIEGLRQDQPKSIFTGSW